MEIETKSGKEKRFADDGNKTELKQSWCFKRSPLSSTRITPCKRKSMKDGSISNLRFDDIEQIAEYYNEDMEPVKRKLPSKSKGLNMTSKIRQTFTMCCTPRRDSSIEDATVDEVEKTVSEKRKEDDTLNNDSASHVMRPKADSTETTDRYDEETLRPSDEMVVSINSSTEDSSVSKVPKNVLQIYADDVDNCILNKIDSLASIQDDLISLANEENQTEETAHSSDSFSSLSSGEIGYLLGEKGSGSNIIKSVWTELKNTTDFRINQRPDINVYLDEWNEGTVNRSDNRFTNVDVSYNQHSSNIDSIFDSDDSERHTPCSVDTLRRLIQPIRDELFAYHSCIFYTKLEDGDYELVCTSDHQTEADSKISRSVDNHTSVTEDQKTSCSHTDSNILQSSCNQNENSETESLEQNNTIIESSNMNNSASEQSSKSEEETNSYEMLYVVYTMLKNDRITFERLPNDFSCGDNESAFVEFKYSDDIFTHEEAKDFLEEINKLINSKAIKFEFSETQELSSKIVISSYDGKHLQLSQEGVEMATIQEYITGHTKEIIDTDLDMSVNTEKSCMLPYSAFLDDVFNSSEDSIKMLTDYITMIRDKRFQIVLKDIHKVGEGEVHSVDEYIAILCKGEYIPVYDGVADDDSNSESRLENYIYIIQGNNFHKAVDLALKGSSGDRYSLSDYIHIIQDKNIYDILGVILQASKLPDHYVKAITHGRILPGTDKYSDDFVDKLTPHRLSAHVARRLDTIRENITLGPGRTSSSEKSFPTSSIGTDYSIRDVDEVDESKPVFMTECDMPSAIEAKSMKNTSQDSLFSITDDAYSSFENVQSPYPSRNKKQNRNADWSVSSPIVRPKTTGNARGTGNIACQLKNRQIKSIYKPSNKNPPAAAGTKTAWPTDHNDASGEFEVKQSKARHDLDHTETKDSKTTSTNQNRIIKHARRQTRSLTKQKNEPVIVTFVRDTAVSAKNDKKPKLNTHVVGVNSDVKADVPKEEETPPVYIETETKVDYGRCVVEPSYGEKPDRKKLRTGKKEKVKTKGQANKHLMVKKEKRDFDVLMDEYLLSIKDDETINDAVEKTTDDKREEDVRAPSPVVVNAVNQPQVLDDREFHLVPDEIKRVDDPFLEDVEELYKVSTPNSNKKEKRKQKADRKKENRSRKSGQKVLKLS